MSNTAISQRDVIPPSQAVRLQLAESLRSTARLKQQLKISEQHERDLEEMRSIAGSVEKCR